MILAGFPREEKFPRNTGLRTRLEGGMGGNAKWLLIDQAESALRVCIDLYLGSAIQNYPSLMATGGILV